MRGLYWRRHGDLRYYTPRRINRFGLGLKLSEMDRRKLDNLTTGREAA
jgi:hypothetical protein